MFDSLDNQDSTTTDVEVNENTPTATTLNYLLVQSASISSLKLKINTVTAVANVVNRKGAYSDKQISSLTSGMVSNLKGFLDLSIPNAENVEIFSTSVSLFPTEGYLYSSGTLSALIDVGSSILKSSSALMSYDDADGLFRIANILLSASSFSTRRRLAEESPVLYDIDGAEYFFYSISIIYADDMTMGQMPLVYTDSSAYYVFDYPSTYKNYRLAISNYSTIDFEDIGYGNRVSGSYYASSLSKFTNLLRIQINDVTLCPAIDYGPIYECAFTVTSRFLQAQKFDEEIYTYSNSTTCENGEKGARAFVCPDGSTVYGNCSGVESMMMFSCVSQYFPRCDIVVSRNSSSSVSTECTTKQFNESHVTCACNMRSVRGPSSPHRGTLAVVVNQERNTTYSLKQVERDMQLSVLGVYICTVFGAFILISSSVMFWNSRDKRHRGHKISPIHPPYEYDENQNHLQAIKNYMDSNYWQPIFQGVYSEMKTSRRIMYELFRSVGFLKVFHTRLNPLPKLGSVMQQNTKAFLFVFFIICSIDFIYPANQYDICQAVTTSNECEIETIVRVYSGECCS